ncbi:MAG: hypothetical protein IJI65_03570 [Lachnospiraceae bacterium]|nr:hypothetical protein [Lachnospiraceae bacterium]
MRFAVDRYKIGIETEVNADEFDGQMYIPARRTRFYCPECGEIVYFRAKGGAHPNQFYHQEKTDQAPECDKRVDGRSELSLRERVGLPLYITRNGSSYELSIGFPALGKDMLSKASEAQYTVEISYGTFSQRISVDHTNFIEDEMTLIPINFLPDWGRNYVITTNGIRAVYGIQRKWSDYADGFDRSGAIFSYSETGGKKIRRGDCISTHRQYYLLTQNRIPDYSEILRSEEGKVSIGSSNFTLYKIEIQVSSDESSRYAEISRYFNRAFGVWLLEQQPELIPLWPPVVEQDEFIPILDKENLICYVSSGNDSPNVYVYSDRGVTLLPKRKENTHLIELSIGRKPNILSVDRKYVGREATFVLKDIYRTNSIQEIRVKKDAELCSIEDLCEDDFMASKFTFITDGKLELYIGEGKKIYKHISIRNHETSIESKSRVREILLLIESGILKQIFPKRISVKTKSFNDNTLHLIVTAGGAEVPLPRWAAYVINSILCVSGIEYSRELARVASTGIIHIDALKHLKQIEQEMNLI